MQLQAIPKKRVFQQPRLKADLPVRNIDVRYAPESGRNQLSR